MKIFGIHISKRDPLEEVEEIAELRVLLKEEKEKRELEAEVAAAKADRMKRELKEAKDAEAVREKTRRDLAKKEALTHLAEAEKYTDSLKQAKGARRSQLQAIVDARVEKAMALGYPLKGSITKTLKSYGG